MRLETEDDTSNNYNRDIEPFLQSALSLYQKEYRTRKPKPFVSSSCKTGASLPGTSVTETLTKKCERIADYIFGDDLGHLHTDDRHCDCHVNILDSASLFVIDRSKADDAGSSLQHHTHSQNSIKDKDQPTTANKEDREKAIERLAKPPTEIMVEKEPSYLDLGESNEQTNYKPIAVPAEPEALKSAAVGNDFEKKHSVPPLSESKKAQAKKNRAERSKTKGKNWFGMQAPELTDELRADIEAVHMRNSFDPAGGYRRNDYKEPPKFFQVATVQDSALDFYHSRIPKKSRKQTLVEELLADAEFKKKNKKMFAKVQQKFKSRRSFGRPYSKRRKV